MTMGRQLIQITQLDIAINQLQTAIELFFSEKDVIATYSLARNAEEILSQIVKHENNNTSAWQFMLSQVKPELLNKFREIADNPRNNFKHKILKANEIFEFDLELNDLFLFIGVCAVRENWSNIFAKNENLIIYHVWYIIHNPEVVFAPVNHPALERLAGYSKKDFYANGKIIAEEYIKNYNN